MKIHTKIKLDKDITIQIIEIRLSSYIIKTSIWGEDFIREISDKEMGYCYKEIKSYKWWQFWKKEKYPHHEREITYDIEYAIDRQKLINKARVYEDGATR